MKTESDKRLTLGSLFDGIGGFPFCAALSGITPIWAAEVDPACVAVTKQRFPNMKHLGDVSKINGAEIPPVDIITFGSPCQDLSVAGERKGLKHVDNGSDETTRSGLFIDAIRIVYEMREATNGRYPTYIVWENVEGAFNSCGGRDFQTVLEKITKTDIPVPQSGKWAKAGVVRGGGVCAAWRLLDAQYWGVPQRRKRIYLIGSFGSDSSAEILFECDSVQRYLAPRKEQAQTSPDVVGKGVARASGFLDRNSAKARGIGYQEECSPTLRAGMLPSVVKENVLLYDARGNGDGIISPTITGDHNNRVTDYTTLVVQNYPFQKGTRPHSADEAPSYKEAVVANTLNCFDVGESRCNELIVQSAGFHGQNSITAAGVELREEQSPTLTTTKNADVVYAIGNGQSAQTDLHKLTYALDCMHDRQAVIYTIDRAAFNQGENALYEPRISDDGTNSTLVAKGLGAVAYGIDCRNFKENEELFPTLQAKENGGISLNFCGAVMYKLYLTLKWIVRRLTPRECERLQGYPDDWTVLPKISELSDEDYEFYKAVFLLDKSIRGKATAKEPDKKKLIRWYNGLDNDGARYRMLGNSLAIPCALRVIGYIADYERRN